MACSSLSTYGHDKFNVTVPLIPHVYSITRRPETTIDTRNSNACICTTVESLVLIMGHVIVLYVLAKSLANLVFHQRSLQQNHQIAIERGVL